MQNSNSCDNNKMNKNNFKRRKYKNPFAYLDGETNEDNNSQIETESETPTDSESETETESETEIETEKQPFFDSSIEKQDYQNLETLLFAAISKGNVQLVKQLIDLGANVNCENEDGYSSLLFAVSQEQPNIVNYLLQSNAQVNKTIKGGVYKSMTSLHIGCLKRSKEIVEILLNANADPNKLAQHDNSPLHIASRYAELNIIQLLLNKGAKINQRDENGLTPVMYASSQGQIETLKLLIKNGADLTIIDYAGESVLHHGFQIQIQRLFKHGFDYFPIQENIIYCLLKNKSSIVTSPKDEIDALDYASEPFRIILEYLINYNHLMPEELNELLHIASLSEDSFFSIFNKISADQIKKLRNAVIEYTIERKNVFEQQSTLGGCPIMSTVSRHNRITKRLGFSKENENNLTTNILPEGHPNNFDINNNDLISKCPFLATKNKEALSKDFSIETRNITEIQTSNSNSNTNSNPNSNSNSNTNSKGKCPIPFHHELAAVSAHIKTKGFWIYVSILITAIIIARTIP
eukprot:TRINITY_DN319_c2_g2_i1.p1 TRINITY_DN319_c2_g2~~TRINITY_DN319_c2_g2_i1.p1  ORF type:complete len:535 (-),score=216.67 TRINITY_DN319_c2_g2_i1:90-1655(-)